MILSAISTPVRVIIDTTRRCPLTCWYCHSSSGPNYRGPEIHPARVPEIFDAAERVRAFDVTVTGGEPTLWEGLLPLLDASRKLSYASLQLITNGLTLSTRVLEAIRRANLSRVCVSLDGVEAVHTSSRGNGTWRRTIDGIRRLRDVINNITVISVLDNGNYNRWPELTQMLPGLGVSQHHLAPVCFAGHAMDEYRGLNERQFAEARRTVDELTAVLPEGFTLRFNDSMVSGMRTRRMSLQQFTEVYKGWSVIVRPNGDVRTAVRAWGRTWRADELCGNINDTPLARILDESARATRHAATATFSRREEVARKFHVGATEQSIATDMQEVRAVETGMAVTPANDRRALPVPPSELGIDLRTLQTRVAQRPGAYRLRREGGFALLFDTISHELCVLTEQETAKLDGALP